MLGEKTSRGCNRGETMTRGTHQVKGNDKVPRLYIIK